MRRGRKPMPPENKAKFKNIAIDAELVEMLNTTADKLAATFGFRPTLSQTIKHLLRKVEA